MHSLGRILLEAGFTVFASEPITEQIVAKLVGFRVKLYAVYNGGGLVLKAKLVIANGSLVVVWWRQIVLVGFKISTKTPNDDFAHFFSVQKELSKNLQIIVVEDFINNSKILLKLSK